MTGGNPPPATPRERGAPRWLAAAAACGAVMPYLSLRVGEALSGAVPGAVVQGLVPALMVAPFYLVYVTLVRRGRFGLAVLASVVWALACTLSTVPVIAASGDRYAALIWNAEAYRDDMFHWIRTGVGQEGSPRLYVPEHARHFAGFVLLSLLSLGFAGLCLGAALLNYMNFYVGCLFANATAPLTLWVFSWPCYAMIRVVGFVVAAIAVTAFGLRVLGRGSADNRRIRVLLWTGFGLVLLDGVIKWLAAPHYREILGGATSIVGG